MNQNKAATQHSLAGSPQHYIWVFPKPEAHSLKYLTWVLATTKRGLMHGVHLSFIQGNRYNKGYIWKSKEVNLQNKQNVTENSPKEHKGLWKTFQANRKSTSASSYTYFRFLLKCQLKKNYSYLRYYFVGWSFICLGSFKSTFLRTLVCKCTFSSLHVSNVSTKNMQVFFWWINNSNNESLFFLF